MLLKTLYLKYVIKNILLELFLSWTYFKKIKDVNIVSYIFLNINIIQKNFLISLLNK
jgi:hypothetical protein